MMLLDIGTFTSDAPGMKHLKTAFVIWIGGILAAHAAEPANMSPAEADSWLAATPAVRILDVRTTEEFADGHLAKATLIPWTDKDFTVRAAKELDPSKPVLVYCRSGRRSAAATAALVKLGFTEVRNLTGGILAWQQAGKPVHKPAPTP